MSARLTVGSDPASVVLVGTQTLAADGDRFVFTGLNLCGVEQYVFKLRTYHQTATAGSYFQINFNDDDTATNYSAERIVATGTTLSSAQHNDARIGYNLPNSINLLEVHVSQIAGHEPRYYAFQSGGTFASQMSRIEAGIWINDDNVTSIEINTVRTGVYMGAGSKCALYKYL